MSGLPEPESPPPPAGGATEEAPVASGQSPQQLADAAEQAQIVAQQAQTTIEAGTPENFDDDGYETDQDSRASTSISSSVRDYSFENGRRYHSFRSGLYQFPNDETEQEREDMKHAMIINLCGSKLHYAPIQNPQNILDIGTGTGIWAIDIGDEYPEAEVLGIDLSPIQPSWLPPNVRFMVDDAESTWIHKPNSLDFIHARHMCSSIKNWPKLLTQAFSALKPGGWVELQELRFVANCDDDTLKDDYQLQDFLVLVHQGLAVFGVDAASMMRNKQLILDAGFVNVEEKIFKIPIGTWPRNKTMKVIGLYMKSVINDGLHAIAVGPLTRGLKWTPEEVELYLIGVRKSLNDITTHSYLPFHVVYGQKPFDA